MAGRSAPASGSASATVRPLPRAAAGDPDSDLSRLAPAEAAMILAGPGTATASEVDAGSSTAPVPPEASMAQATPAASAVAAVQDSAALPAATLAPAATDKAAAAYLAAAPQVRRPVDIEQIADSEVRSLAMVQIREPGLAAGSAPTLAARVDAMQITLPPPRLGDAERAALLTEAPSQLLVRVGDTALGSVALRASGAHGFDVQLSGLLELLADRFDSGEFERLRGSAAADTFVNFASFAR